jgi:hypothetical protein
MFQGGDRVSKTQCGRFDSYPVCFDRIAQLVEHLIEDQGVLGSIPSSVAFISADVAQLVEHFVANEIVVGSNPIIRSNG